MNLQSKSLIVEVARVGEKRLVKWTASEDKGPAGEFVVLDSDEELRAWLANAAGKLL